MLVITLHELIAMNLGLDLCCNHVLTERFSPATLGLVSHVRTFRLFPLGVSVILCQELRLAFLLDTYHSSLTI